MPVSATILTPDVEQAIEEYERRLKPILEAEHSGESLAIDVDSGEYELGGSHLEAARRLKVRRPPESRIVTLTIGPPTAQEIALAQRMAGIR